VALGRVPEMPICSNWKSEKCICAAEHEESRETGEGEAFLHFSQMMKGKVL